MQHDKCWFGKENREGKGNLNNSIRKKCLLEAATSLSPKTGPQQNKSLHFAEFLLSLLALWQSCSWPLEEYVAEKLSSSPLSSNTMRMEGMCSDLPHQNQIRGQERKHCPKCLYITAVFLGVSLEGIIPRLLQEQTYNPCVGQGPSQYRQYSSSIIPVLEMCSQNNPCHLNKKLIKRLKCIYCI